MFKKLLISTTIVMLSWACQQQKSDTTTVKNKTLNTVETSMPMKTLHDYQSTTLYGDELDFADLKGKRVLLVNTASACGYTPQYEQLQELYDTYGNSEFTIVGFPSNDFGGQEPGSNEEIAAFCQKNYGVTFPMMAKTPVKGANQHPVYQWLTQKELNGKQDVTVEWNFNKFLVNEKGEWVAYYPSGTTPLDEKIIAFAEGKK